jgi:hypothetical protein
VFPLQKGNNLFTPYEYAVRVVVNYRFSTGYFLFSLQPHRTGATARYSFNYCNAPKV